MDKKQLGQNAGVVWKTLYHQRLSWEELLKSTGLNPLELAGAIGWLAREDKIAMMLQNSILYFETYHECYY